MTGPIQTYTQDELKRMNEEIEKMKRDALHGMIDAANSTHLQEDLQRLLNDPSVPQHAKDHIHKLMQDFANDPKHINVVDLAHVQNDINSLPISN